MRERALEFSIVIKDGQGRKLGTGFLVHESGLLATCWHVVRDAFPDRRDYVGLKLSFAPLEELSPNVLEVDDPPLNGGTAVVYALDEINDAALLEIDGQNPFWLKPTFLINSRVAAGKPFSIYAYAKVPDEQADYQTFAASGQVIDVILRNGVYVLQLSSKNLFQGMSGGAIYSPSWNGVIGMQSKRLLIDPKIETFGKETGFACPAEAIVALAPDRLKLIDPPDVSTIPGASLYTAGVTIVNNIDSAGLKAEWVRPNEFDNHQRWRGAISRQSYLSAILGYIGAAREGVHALALWGMHGIGKSTLASLYVSEYGSESEYPGGVLWVDLGLNFQPDRDAPPVIERWAEFAYGNVNRLHQFSQSQRLVYSPTQIRSLLSGKGEMLIVFDDVTNLEHLEPFWEIVPNSANLLLTTTDRDLLRRIRIPFEEFEIRAMSEGEAEQLLHQKLPEFERDNILKIAESFDYHPQAMVLVASDILSQVDPQMGLLRVLKHQSSPSGGLAPIWSAYTLSLESLPTQRDRERIALLSILNEISADFSDEIAAAIWDEPLSIAQDALKLLHRRVLINYNEQRRWSMHILLRQYAASLLIDQDSRRAAEFRYRAYIFSKAAQTTSWTMTQPDLAHFLAVITRSIHDLTEWFSLDLDSRDLTDLTSTLLSSEQIDWLQRFAQVLSTSLQFMLVRPEMYSICKRWITAYIEVCLLLDYPETVGWGWFAMGRWYILGEDLDNAAQAFDKALSIGEDTGSLSLIGYSTLAKGGIIQRTGRIREAIDGQRQLYERLLDEYDNPDPYLEVSLLVSLSRLYLSNFTYDYAKSYLEKARSLLEGMVPDLYLSLQVTQQLGMLYINQQQIPEGLNLLKQAKQISVDLEDERIRAETTVNIAYAYYQQGDHERAEDNLDQAEEILQNITYLHLRSAILLYRAAIRFAQGKLPIAMDLLNEVQETLKNYPDKNIEAQSCLVLGEIHIRQGQMDEALWWLKKALPLMRDLDNTSTGVMVLNAIGGIFEQTNRIEEGLQFFQEWLPVIQDLNNSGAQVTILNWLAILLSRIGNVGQAMQYFDSALRIADKLENASERATILTVTGTLYRFGGEIDKAFECFVKVETAWRSLSNQVKLREILLQLASLELLRGNLQQVEKFLDEVETFIDDTLESQSVLSALLNMRGVINLRLEQYDKAKVFLEEAQRINEVFDIPTSQIDTLNNLAYLALFNQDIEEAISYLESALENAYKINFEPQIALILSSLGWMRLIQGKTPIAADHFEEAAQTLEKAGFLTDVANQSIEQIRGFAELARSQGVADSPLDTLRLILDAVSWEAITFIIRVRQETLLSPQMQDVFRGTITGARSSGQHLAARVLDVLRRVVEDCRHEGFGVLQRSEREYITLDMERWWAQLLRANGNYSAARTSLNHILERTKGDVDALIERGWTYRGLGQIQIAIEDFEHAIKLAQGDYRPHQGLGVIYFDTDQLDKAVGHLTKAVLQMPTDTYNYQWRGAVYQSLGDFASADLDLDRAISAAPHLAIHRYWRGLLKLQMKKFGDASEIFTKLIEEERNSNTSLVYNYLWQAVSTALFGNQRAAKLEWERGINIAKSIRESWALPLYYLLYTKDEDKAKQITSQLLDRANMWHQSRQFRRHLILLGQLYPEDTTLSNFTDWLEIQLSDLARTQ